MWFRLTNGRMERLHRLCRNVFDEKERNSDFTNFRERARLSRSLCRALPKPSGTMAVQTFKIEVIQNSVHYVADEQPNSVSQVIDGTARYDWE